MHLQTVARDCLYVNWAVPIGAAPLLPPTLRYETHEWQGDCYVLATALFFRFVGLHSPGLPWARLSYPQMSLRLHVRDGDDVASVLFLRMLVPRWVAPVAQCLGRQPATGARFEYPASSGAVPLEEQTWKIRQDGELVISCRPSAPIKGPGPDLGGWSQTVDYVRRRSRGYVFFEGGVRRVRRRQPTIQAMPMATQVHRADLLESSFQDVDGTHWSTPHSAWLCPEIPVAFELGELQILPIPSARRGMTTVPDGC